MHQGENFQFERAVREFSQWRAIPEDERSPAPAWCGNRLLKCASSMKRWRRYGVTALNSSGQGKGTIDCRRRAASNDKLS
jgi:hypothetical protein